MHSPRFCGTRRTERTTGNSEITGEPSKSVTGLETTGTSHLLLGPHQRVQLKQRTRFLKLRPRQPQVKFRSISVSQIAQEVGLHVTSREELLLASFTFFPGVEKLLVEFAFSNPRLPATIDSNPSPTTHGLTP